MAARSWRLPAEWEPQDGVLLAWPHAGTDWAANLAAVENTYVELVGAIARFEQAVVCVDNDALAARARGLLERRGARLDRVRFVPVEYDDTWLRDSGPLTLMGEGRYRLMDFRFTGWGGKFEGSRDDLLTTRLYERGLFRLAEHRRVGWALEGGAIESDGQGTLMTTFQCLHQRHPHLSHGELSKVLDHHLHAERVHMIEHGYLQGDDTDAHIDTLARFAPNRTIVYQACDRADDPHFAALHAMAAELAALRTRDGMPYRLIALPWAQAIFSEGRRLAASYANFLIINDAVLMPAYGDPADAHAQLLLAKAFAPRQIVPIPCRPLIEQNGSLHCVTMQVPAGALHVG